MKILFQGDSITDAGRKREIGSSRGMGYLNLVAAKLGFEYPDQYEFVNRGISGNRVTDLLTHIRKDMINEAPDVMSILIGVNDVWHEFSERNGVGAELFETVYELLIRELKAALPNLRILIMEPFVLRGTATEAHLEEFQAEVALRGAAARRVAEKHGLEFIALQEKFDEASKLAPETYWLYDGFPKPLIFSFQGIGTAGILFQIAQLFLESKVFLLQRLVFKNVVIQLLGLVRQLAGTGTDGGKDAFDQQTGNIHLGETAHHCQYHSQQHRYDQHCSDTV